MNAYHEYGFSSYEDFAEAYKNASSKMSVSHAEVKKIEAAIKEKKELQRHLLNYIAAKPARDGLREQKSEKAREAYREKHTADLILSDTARRYFKEHGIDKLPTPKMLQAEIETLTAEQNRIYTEYRGHRDRYRELQIIKVNIDKMLNGEPKKQKRKEQEL